MVSLKNKQKGFTIVELLIVIVVIGILATLVIVTFTGIQQKGRNTQRQTDIKALNGYVESFYAEYGFYPTGVDMQTDTFRAQFMKGLDPKALTDPKQADTETISTTLVPPTDANPFVYSYVASNSGTGTCSTAATTLDADGEPTDNGCDAYVLQANLEGPGGKTYVKESN